MHGTKHASISPGRLVRSLYGSRFGDCRFTASGRAASCSSTGPFARISLLLARNAIPISRTPFQGHCSWPSTSLCCRKLCRPFGFSAPQPDWLGRAVSSHQTRCNIPLPASSAASLASAPRRESYFPKDHSVLQVPLRSGPPSGSTRFPITPRNRFARLGCGSSFPGRYVSGGSTVPRTSWNHLQYPADRSWSQ